MASNETLPKMVLTGATQLDPETCGSSLRWSIVSKQTKHSHNKKDTYCKEWECSVTLTDCSRQITWSGNSYDGGAMTMLKKIDAAVEELRRFRRCIKHAEKFHAKIETTKDDNE